MAKLTGGAKVFICILLGAIISLSALVVVVLCDIKVELPSLEEPKDKKKKGK